LDEPTSAFHKIQFMTSIDLLHVSATGGGILKSGMEYIYL